MSVVEANRSVYPSRCYAYGTRPEKCSRNVTASELAGSVNLIAHVGWLAASGKVDAVAVPLGRGHPMAEKEGVAAQAQALVAWASELLVADGSTDVTRQAIGRALCRLGREIGPIDETALADLHGSTVAATVLARLDDGPVLMLARFPSDAPTPVHNHNSWGIVCVIRGRDRYLRWDRLDDAVDQDHARLALAEERELRAADVAFLDEPPGDIHSQQGIDGPVWELVFFGRDPDRLPRAYFEPESGAVTYASSAR